MSQFIHRALLLRASSRVSLQNPNNVCYLRLRWFSVSSGRSENDKKSSFVVSYLVKSLGLSPKHALSASKHLHFKIGEKPDKIVQFLIDFGFSRTQIANVVRLYPRMLCTTQGNVLPKLEYLKSKGIPSHELVKMLSSDPRLLTASLSDTIVPTYDYIWSVIWSDERTVEAVKRSSQVLGRGFKKIALNVEILRGCGVPESRIATLMVYHARLLQSRLDRFRCAVAKAVESGINASTAKFLNAVRISLSLSELTRQRKINVYKECGFSEEEVSKAVLSEPLVLVCSERKIRAFMDFIVGEMNWSPSLVASNMKVVRLSLEKRVIPRCLLFKALLSKELVAKKKKIALQALLGGSEEVFLKKFVKPYEKEFPELREIYERKLSLRSDPERR